MLAQTPPFVGRDRELDIIDTALDAADSGQPRLLLVVGEPGIGKTRLLTELVDRAAERGHLVLSGRGAEIERDLPFGPVVDALDDFVASIDPADLKGLGEERLRALAVVFPGLSAFAGPALRTERYRSYRATRTLLEMLSRPRPLVLALDDLHWADQGSLELIAHLLRAPPQGPVLLTLAFRPAQLPTSLASSLERAAREGSALFLRLGSLSQDEADRVVGLDVDPATRSELFRQSGGNPFYLQELARATERRSVKAGPSLPDIDIEVPESVRAALAAELGALDTSSRNLLEGAAVAGDPFDTDLAAVAAEMPEPDALASLDHLGKAELIGSTDVPRRFRFRHPLVRLAVYQLAGTGWRLGAHARLAAALADRGAPALARAHHVERSAPVGDEQAIAVLAEAGHTARDPATAARWLEAALRLLPEDQGHAARRIELLGGLATALGLAGRIHDAHQLLGHILEQLPQDQVTLRSGLEAYCANVEHHLGHIQPAHERLLRAIEAIPEQCSPEAALLKMELAFNTCSGFWVEFGEARALADDAYLTAQSLGQPPLIARAAAYRAYLDATNPVAADSSKLLVQASQFIDGLADSGAGMYLDGPLKLGWAELFLERFEDSVRHLKRGIEIARVSGQEQYPWIMLVGQVLSLLALGRLAEAAEAADDAVDAARLTEGADAQLAWTLACRSAVATPAGELETALSFGEEAFAARESVGFLWAYTATLGWALPDALLQAGDPERARQVMTDLVAGREPRGFLPSMQCRIMEVLSRAELALANRDAAARWAARAEEIAGGVYLMMSTVFARRASAAVALANGDHDRAAELALESADAAEHVQARIEAGRSRILAGRAQVLAGLRDEAVTELVRAEAELAACGAEGYRAEAARELRRLGRRVMPGRRGVIGIESLTPRELEVAEMVAAGKSTPEIAMQLFVSPRTVESHIAHIFGKLGVSSRKAVGPALRRVLQPTAREGTQGA